MKDVVFVAIWYSRTYSDTGYHLLGVYSTKEKAEERVAEFKNSSLFRADPERMDSDSFYVCEQKVDEKILTVSECYEEE